MTFLKRGVAGVIFAAAFALTACGGSDDVASTTASETTSLEETTTTTAPTSVEETFTLETAPGVDPEMGPQEWFDEAIYRANDCASQSISYGGVAMCEIREVDTEDGGTLLVGYLDQDREGVQEHFAMEQRRDMFVQAFAERVGQAKYEGEPRVQHVTRVRVIASGGEGFMSGWQGEAEVS